jgi:hypothetical protein
MRKEKDYVTFKFEILNPKYETNTNEQNKKFKMEESVN